MKRQFLRAVFYAFALGFGIAMFVIYPAGAPTVAWLFATFGCSAAPMLLIVQVRDMLVADRHAVRVVVSGE